MLSRTKSPLGAAIATVLLAPALFIAGLAFAVTSVTSGWLFGFVTRLLPMLPSDPALVGIILPVAALGCVTLLVVACLFLPRLYPVLLLVVGGAAEIFAIALTDLSPGRLLVPTLGAGGLLLAALQIRNAHAPACRNGGGGLRRPVPPRRADNEAMSNVKARLLGAAMMGAAVAVAWYGGLRPLQMAQAGVPTVEYSMKAFMAAPLAALGGLALLLGGAPVMRSFGGPPKGRVQVVVTMMMVGIAFVVGGVGYWWVGSQLRILGYDVG